MIASPRRGEAGSRPGSADGGASSGGLDIQGELRDPRKRFGAGAGTHDADAASRHTGTLLFDRSSC